MFQIVLYKLILTYSTTTTEIRRQQYTVPSCNIKGKLQDLRQLGDCLYSHLHTFYRVYCSQD